jgi:hypothetical protein
MALITCPECGTQVSDKAERCPKCAYPINPVTPISSHVIEKKTEVVVQPKEGCFLQTLNMGCMIVVVVIGLILLIALLGHC